MKPPLRTFQRDGRTFNVWDCDTCGKPFERQAHKPTLGIIAHTYCSRMCATVGNKKARMRPDGHGEMMRFRYYREPQI